MWGWDYPHIENADWLTPRENIRALMQGVPEDELRALVAGNAVAAYGLDAGSLAGIAARVGPRVGELVSG